MPPEPSARLAFRAWTDALRPDAARMARDPEVMRYITDGIPWDDQRIDDFMERQQRYEREHGHSMWWIGPRDSAEGGATENIGLCGFQPVPDGSHFEIGWWLRPAYWGNGYATEAARQVLDWVWAETDHARVVAHTVEANVGSWKIMERLGMSRLGVFAAADQGRPGLDIDLLVYAIERPSA